MARRWTPPALTTTSTRKVWEDRPRSSTAAGVGVSGADTSLAAWTVMYVRTSGMERWLGMVTTSAIENSPTTARVPIGAGKVQWRVGGASSRYSNRPLV